MGLSARETLERHMQALVDGNMEIVRGDLVPDPEVVKRLKPLAEALGEIEPTGYEFHSEAKEGDYMVFKYKYLGKKGSLPLQSTWALIGDAWKVVDAKIIEL